MHVGLNFCVEHDPEAEQEPSTMPESGGDVAHRVVFTPSARTGAGLDRLRAALRAAAGLGEGSDGAFSARARHVAALERAAAHLALGAEAFGAHRAGELLAEELRLAHQALGEITGQTTVDDLLGRIFGEFCIGK